MEGNFAIAQATGLIVLLAIGLGLAVWLSARFAHARKHEFHASEPEREECTEEFHLEPGESSIEEPRRPYF